MTEENADDARVGVVSNVWFNDKDGWYWCDGIIWDKTAQNLITDKGWSVSCSYDVKLADDTGGTENNIHYDIEFLDGVFIHLAIVDNPRYERANIVFNSKTVVQNGGEGSGNFEHDGRPEEVGGSAPKGEMSERDSLFFKKWENAPEIELKTSDWDNISDIKELRQKAKDYFYINLQGKVVTKKGLGDIRISGKSSDEFFHISADPDKLRAVPQIPELIEKGKLGEFEPDYKGRTDYIEGFYPVYVNLKTNTDIRKTELLIGKDKEGNLFYQMFLDYDREQARKKRNTADNQDRLSLNNIITDNQEDFNPDMKNNEVDNNKENTDMTLIDELKKLITKVENDKGNKMSPSYSNGNNRPYRYYISISIKNPVDYERGEITKISAGEIEKFVQEDLVKLLQNTHRIQNYLENYPLNQQKIILEKMQSFEPDKVFLRTAVKMVNLKTDCISISYDITYIIKYFATLAFNTEFNRTDDDELTITNQVQVKISLTPQRQNKIIIPGKANYDMKLIQAVVKSFWYNKLGAERRLPIEARNGNNKRLRKLRFLPPEIIESIMNGAQDPELNVKKLIEMAEKCCK